MTYEETSYQDQFHIICNLTTSPPKYADKNRCRNATVSNSFGTLIPMPFSAVSQGMHTLIMCNKILCKMGGGITFYIGYAQFPNSVDFHKKNNQSQYPNLFYFYYLVDRPIFHEQLPLSTRCVRTRTNKAAR